MSIAKTAVTAAEQNEAFAGTGEIRKDYPVLLIQDLCTDRNAQYEILAAGAGTLTARARPAVLCPKMLPVPVIDQGVEVFGRDKHDVSTFAAIAAVRAAELDEFFAAEAHRATAAIAALQVDLTLIEELHSHQQKGEQPGRSPLAQGCFRGTAIRRPRSAAPEARPKHRSVRPARRGT